MSIMSYRRNMIINASNDHFLTFSSSNAISIALSGTATKAWDGTLEYSTDKVHWYVWDGTAPIASAINYGEHRLYLRGNGNTVITGDNYANSTLRVSGSGISIYGNIDTLLDWKTIRAGGHPAMGNGAMRSLFAYPSSAPSNAIVDVSGIIFPDRLLTEYCYRLLFSNCSGITVMPKLPSVRLANGCYFGMFQNCSGILLPRNLPATTLAESCYNYMFRGCIGLIALPKLKATTLPKQCYYAMFNSCSSIKVSTSQTEEYSYSFRIPDSGTGTAGTDAMYLMFGVTGGSFKSTPSINTTYYTTHELIG